MEADLSTEYHKGQHWGISAAIDLHNCHPEKVRSARHIKRFVRELCDLINVKRYGNCRVVHFGEREDIAGFSMTQLIETSLVSGHFVNKTNNIHLDVFSCNFFDPKTVAKKAVEFFEAESFTVTHILRK